VTVPVSRVIETKPVNERTVNT